MHTITVLAWNERKKHHKRVLEEITRAVCPKNLVWIHKARKLNKVGRGLWKKSPAVTWWASLESNEQTAPTPQQPSRYLKKTIVMSANQLTRSDRHKPEVIDTNQKWLTPIMTDTNHDWHQSQVSDTNQKCQTLTRNDRHQPEVTDTNQTSHK